MATKKSITRRLILEQLAAIYPNGAPQNLLKTGLKVGGVNVSDNELIVELAYLADKGFAKTQKDALSASNVYYFITVQGLDLLDS